MIHPNLTCFKAYDIRSYLGEVDIFRFEDRYGRVK